MRNHTTGFRQRKRFKSTEKLISFTSVDAMRCFRQGVPCTQFFLYIFVLRHVSSGVDGCNSSREVMYRVRVMLPRENGVAIFVVLCTIWELAVLVDSH